METRRRSCASPRLPKAKGIVAAAKERGIAVPRPASVRNITGGGIAAVVEGQEVRVVSPGYLARLGRTISDPRLPEFEARGKSVVVLVRGGEPRALFALADIVRPESREAVAQLKETWNKSDNADRGRGGSCKGCFRRTRHRRIHCGGAARSEGRKDQATA